jgi:hypothetical protein
MLKNYNTLREEFTDEMTKRFEGITSLEIYLRTG